MRTGPARAAVLVVGALALGFLALVGSQPRTVSGYEVRDGEVVQVSLSCGSILAGGGLESVGEPTGVEVPQDEGLEVDPGLACPEEGPLWLAAFAVVAVLIVGGVMWGWVAVGHRAERSAG